jgi:hypothetical protein
VVTLGLMVVGMFAGPFLPRRRYWWGVLLVLVVLSFGGRATIGAVSFDLPGQWLYDWCPLFRLTRAPSRFNLFAAIVAAVVSAAAWAGVLSRFPRPSTRAGLTGLLAVVMLVDLSLVPSQERLRDLPDPPGCYAYLQREAPGKPFLETPQFLTGSADDLSALVMYWQSIHRGPTTAGYSGFANSRYDRLIYHPSPFADKLLRSPDAWEDKPTRVDLVEDVDLAGYAWLYLTVHALEHLVIHNDQSQQTWDSCYLKRLKERMRHACVYDDGRAAVCALRLLAPPSRPTLLCTEGWGTRLPCLKRNGRTHIEEHALVSACARMTLYNPDADGLYRFYFTAESGGAGTRIVRLLAAGTEVARWEVQPGESQVYASEEFYLPAGLGELVLESDAETVPPRREQTGSWDARPFSLRVSSVRLVGLK